MAGTNITDYINLVNKVINELPSEFESIAKKNEKSILDLNRQNQLYDKGEDIDGNKLLAYRPFTIEIKQLIGQPYDRTTLFYSGQFYNSFKQAVYPKEYKIDLYATDIKTLPLVAKYGDIIGLQKQNIEVLDNEIIKPELYSFIKKWLQ